MENQDTKEVLSDISDLRNALKEMNVCIEDMMVGVEDFGRAEKLIIEETRFLQNRTLKTLKDLPRYKEMRAKAALRKKIEKTLDNLVFFEQMPLNEAYNELRKLQEEGGRDSDVNYITYKLSRMSLNDPEPKGQEKEAVLSRAMSF